MRNYSPLTIVSYLLGPTLIITSHIGSLLVLVTGLSWGALVWIIGLYLIRMLATTAIYHRLLTHRSYEAPKLILWIGCIIGASAGQMGPSWWKAHHLCHHQHADRDRDPHSPYTPLAGVLGFYWSQGGWLLSSQFFPEKLPPDVERDGFLRLLDRWHFVPTLALAGLSYAIGDLEYLGAFFLSTTLLFHGVQTVNSIAHLTGDRPFTTKDDSRHNGFVAFLTLGEGWHNLHHAFPSSCRHGITIRSGEIAYLPDPTYRFIQMLQWLQLGEQLRIPSTEDLLKRANPEGEELPIAVKTPVRS